MATANTNDLRLHNARNFIDSLHAPNGAYRGYVFLGRTTPWEVDSETQEELPPTPTSSVKEYYDTFHEMISLKNIEQDDVFFMINRNAWSSGTVYDIYRHDYEPGNVSYSGANNLWNAYFYVINQNNVVYVCLDNNNNSASTVEPQSDSNEAFYTSDNYLWIKIFTISVGDFYNHSTDRYLPVTTDSHNSTTEGAVYTVKIEVPGFGFTNNPTGIANQVPSYFCKIKGDGSGAVARVDVVNQKVTSIVVVRNGSGYTYGVLDFTPFNVYTTLTDLDKERNALDPLGDGTFRSTVIISPPGGWGYNDEPSFKDTENDLRAEIQIARQLGAARVGVFSTLSYPLADFAKDTLFRQVGILQDPDFTASAGYNPDTATACFAVKMINSDFETEYIIGETIRQVVQVLDTGEPDKYAIGQVVGWDNVSQVLRYIQIPEKHSDIDGVLYRFQGDQDVEGLTSGKGETPDIGYNAPLSGVQFVNGYAEPEVKPYSGMITHLLNISPIKRQPTQSEKISLIITY